MRFANFESACKQLFRGWDGVEVFEHHSDLFVTLHVSEKRLLASRNDAERLLNQLFSKVQLDDLARRIVSHQRARGLRRYGRKRR